MKDNSWKLIGDQNPYFGVLSHPKFNIENIDEDQINIFFNTGKEYTATILKTLKEIFKIPENKIFESVLDFGCGTGRLVIPFSTFSNSVTGVDISEGMLQKAQLHIDERGIKNITLLQIDNIIDYEFKSTFSIVHTFIVLQHINQKYGYSIINKLTSIIEPNGYGIIHFTFKGKLSFFEKNTSNLKRKYKFLNQLFNLLKGRPLNRPFMQMNEYDCNKIFADLYAQGIRNFFTEFTNHDDFLGMIIYFKK